MLFPSCKLFSRVKAEILASALAGYMVHLYLTFIQANNALSSFKKHSLIPFLSENMHYALFVLENTYNRPEFQAPSVSSPNPPPPPPPTHTLIPKSKGLSGFFFDKRTDHVFQWTAEGKSTILSTSVKTKIISVNGCVRDLIIYIKTKDNALFCDFRLLPCGHTRGFLMQMGRNFC